MTQSCSSPLAARRDFEAEVQRVLSDLRSACSGLIAALSHDAGTPIRRATDLQRTLKIRATVAWQLFRLATAEDPVREAEAVPGPIAVSRVIETARDRGVPEDRLQRLMSCVLAFDRLVQAHAGSRKAFNSMIASLSTEATDAIDMQSRRSAFHANSHIWGLQARACLWSTTYFPGRDSEHISAVSLRGPVGVKRLRADAPYIVSGYVAFERDADPSQPEPLGSPDEPESPDPRLLLPFCTRPLPRISSSLTNGQFVVTEMPPGPIGNAGASTILLADVARDSAWKHDDEKPTIVNSMGVATPFEVLVVDTLFHRSMFGRLTPRPRVFGRHSFPLGLKPHLYRDSDTLPMAVQAAYLGRGPSVIESPDIPRYPEMYEHVCSRLGLDPMEFDLYRCRVEYPILHAHVGVWFDLPDTANW